MARRLIALLALALSSCARTEAAPARVESSRPAVAAPAPLAQTPTPAPAPTGGPTPYPFDRTHSPLDATVVGRIREIARANPKLRADSFAKVGDSVTASGDFLHCFASRERTRLGEHGSLGAMIERFRESELDPFRRESAAARVGWSAWIAVAGSPSPLERELAALSPRFALVQFGTNDIEIGQLHYFADRLFDVVDFLISRGSIPILFTIMPRRDRREAAVWVPRYNAVIRGIAQTRQIPLVDYHREIVGLPGAGLAKDGIHPTTFHGDLGRNACDLGARGLDHGYNLRNLLALEALDRTARALEGAALEPPPARLPGSGTRDDPWRVSELPFVDAPRFGDRRELFYRLEIERPRALRVLGFDRRAEVDLHLAGKFAERILEARLEPGQHDLTLTASAFGAETLLVLLED